MNVWARIRKSAPLLGSVALALHACANEWRDRWMTEMDDIRNTPVANQIERLGSAVGAKSTSAGWKPTEDQQAVASRAIELLTAIPGHAEFFRDKILGAQKEVKEHLDDSLISIRLAKYVNERTDGFKVLGQLPSVENVRVLGELLSNDWTGGLSVQEGAKVFPLSHDAARALGTLPLIHKPFDATDADLVTGHLEAWRQWYEEIKSGKRTFRFEGDPTEYDLNGPASAEKMGHITRDRKRDEERTAGQHKSTPAPPEVVARAIRIPGPGILAVMVAVGLLAAAGVTRWARGRW